MNRYVLRYIPVILFSAHMNKIHDYIMSSKSTYLW